MNSNLWPTATLSAIIVTLNYFAWLGKPLAPNLNYLAIPLVVSLSLLWLIVRREFAFWLLGMAGAFLAAWLATVNASGEFIPSLYISAHPDAWSYDAMADYLLHYGREETEGMPLVSQFAVHLRAARFTSACLLAIVKALFSSLPFFIIHSLFYFFILVVAFSSALACANKLGHNFIWSFLFAFLYVSQGWCINAIIIGNYDNLVFVALFPAIIALTVSLNEKTDTFWSFIAAFGLILAATFYTYPEGCALASLGYLPLLIWLIIKSENRAMLLTKLGLSLALAVLFIVPYLPYFLGFLVNQMSSNCAGQRPGAGNFPGLLNGRFLPSFFAVGCEYPGSPSGLFFQLLAGVLFLILSIGIIKSFRKGWYLFSLSSVLALFTYQVMIQKYDYGAYKTIFCNNWLILGGLVAGMKGIVLSRKMVRRVLLLAALIVVLLFAQQHYRRWRVWPQTADLKSLHELKEIENLVMDKGISIDLLNSFDQMWACSILQKHTLVVSNRLGYLAMPHVQSWLEKAKPCRESVIEYSLEDKKQEVATWNNKRFSLIHLEVPRIQEIQNPNGIETVEGKPFFWIGSSRPTSIKIFSPDLGQFYFAAEELWLGPSLPESKLRTICITDSNGRHSQIVNCTNPKILFNLQKGFNNIEVYIKEKPTCRLQTNGDNRELMLGVKNYYLDPKKAK